MKNGGSSYADAQWADPDDIAKKHAYNPDRDFFIGRNPFNYHQAIGYDDDTHVFMCAGTGAGKGRSIIINNLLQWKGSIVSVDPKGENASICAARRANGDEYCEGLGQNTYVLDPYGQARVPDDLRASCNLLDMIDPNSPSLLTDCETLAEAMRVVADGGESESWAKEGAKITALIIAHVKTSPYLQDHERTLVKAREYITSGLDKAFSDYKKGKAAEIRKAKSEGRDPKNWPNINDAHELLLIEISKSEAQRGKVAGRAKAKLSLMSTNPKQWGSQLENAVSETGFLDDLQIEDQIKGGRIKSRSLNLNDLKKDPKGISIFICLPDNSDHPAVRWQNAVIALILETMSKNQELPTTGKKVLMVLDEFASMGKNKKIANGMNSIRGAGVKLFVIVTHLGNLKDYYGQAWTGLIAGCNLQIYFGINDNDTGEYISKQFGDTEIELVSYTESATESVGASEGDTQTHSRGVSKGESKGIADTKGTGGALSSTETHNQSLSITDARSWGKSSGRAKTDTASKGSSWQHNKNRGWGTNKSSGENRGLSDTHDPRPFQLFGPTIHSTNENRGTSLTSGKNNNQSVGSSQGGNTSASRAISINSSHNEGGSLSQANTTGKSNSTAQTDSWNESQTLSNTYTTTASEQKSWAKSRSENWSRSKTRGRTISKQKRPLISMSETNRYLSGFKDKEREHPSYPGFLLIRMAREDAFMLRKCYYDQDPLFENCFTPHYAYAKHHKPFSEQRLVGGQYTPDHFVPIRLPKDIMESDIDVKVALNFTTDQWFKKGDKLFHWTAPTVRANQKRFELATANVLDDDTLPQVSQNPVQLKSISIAERVGAAKTSKIGIKAPFAGKVIDFALAPAFEQSGDILLLRMEKPFSQQDRVELESGIFEQIKEYMNTHERYQTKLTVMIEAANTVYQRNWKAEQKKQAEERAAAALKRKSDEARIAANKQQELDNFEAVEFERLKELVKFFWIAVAVAPVVLMVLLTTLARENPSMFEVRPTYEVVKIKNDASFFSKRCVSGTITNVRKPIFSKNHKYKCKVKSGESFSMPRNYQIAIMWVGGASIAFGFGLMLFFGGYYLERESRLTSTSDFTYKGRDVFVESLKDILTDKYNYIFIGIGTLILVTQIINYEEIVAQIYSGYYRG